MHLSPDEEAAIGKEFHRLTNLSQAELKAWLKTPQSHKVGMVRKGETESVGRQSAKKILTIRDKAVADLTDADYRHMKKVIGYCRRHLAQRPPAYKKGGGRDRDPLALEPDELGPRPPAALTRYRFRHRGSEPCWPQT